MRKLEDYEQQFLNIMANVIRRKYESKAEEESEKDGDYQHLKETESYKKSS